MATLHLVRSSAFNSNDFQQCVSLVQHNDGIILLDDGCYNLTHPLLKQAQDKLANNIFVIEHHYLARSIEPNPQVTKINMEKLVQLTLNFDKTLTWQ